MSIGFAVSDYLPDELLNSFHLIIPAVLAFGIGGYPLGADMHAAGSSIVFLPAVLFIVTAFWGCILGLLTKDFNNVKMLAGAGIVGGLVSSVVANLGGLVVFALMGWLLLLIPFFFPVFIYYFFKRNEKLISVAFIMLLIYVIIDWIFIYCNNTMSTDFSFYSLHAFVFALAGLIIGYSYGWVIKKPTTMAVFGMVGLSLGSYWIGILFDPYAYMTNSHDILIYSLVSVTTGIFLVTGLYYPEKPDTGNNLSEREKTGPVIKT